MTIKVTIENGEQEGGRVIEVREMERTTDEQDWRQVGWVYLNPKESRTFYVHLARRIIVEERMP